MAHCEPAEHWGLAPGNSERLRRPVTRTSSKIVSEAMHCFKAELNAIKPTHGQLFAPSPSPSPSRKPSMVFGSSSGEGILIKALQGLEIPLTPPRSVITSTELFDADDLEEIDKRLELAERQATSFSTVRIATAPSYLIDPARSSDQSIRASRGVARRALFPHQTNFPRSSCRRSTTPSVRGERLATDRREWQRQPSWRERSEYRRRTCTASCKLHDQHTP
jgi:hypothetical protein